VDDRISRGEYFAQCWPNSEHIRAFHLENLLEDGDTVFVRYRMESHGQAPCRNTEVFTIRDGKIGHVDVYFGADTAESVTQEEIRGVIERRAEAIRRKMRSRPPHVLHRIAPGSRWPAAKAGEFRVAGFRELVCESIFGSGRRSGCKSLTANG
jgi:hypothetical protein